MLENLESANNDLKKALAVKPLSGPQLEEKAKEVDVQLQNQEICTIIKNLGLRMWRCCWLQRLWSLE